jgi:uncharacterized membrane protein YczE
VATGRARQAVAPARPWLWMLVGSAILGAGVALLIRAELGLAPYDVLLSAIARGLDITHGQAGWLVAGGLLLVASILGRRPRIATVAWVLTNGVAIDAVLPLLEAPDALVTRIVFAAAGTCAIAAGVALVLHSGGTGGAFELIIKALGDRGLKPVPVRTVMEFTTLATGLALAGDAGLATIAFAMTFGSLVVGAERALDDHRVGRALRLAASRSGVGETHREDGTTHRAR